MEAVDWEMGLPLGILSAIAQGRDELKVMRLVCKNWQTGFNTSIKCIRVTEKGPLVPASLSFSDRFPMLTSLDIGRCPMGGNALAPLLASFRQRPKKLSSLTLGCGQSWWYQMLRGQQRRPGACRDPIGSKTPKGSESPTDPKNPKASEKASGSKKTERSGGPGRFEESLEGSQEGSLGGSKGFGGSEKLPQEGSQEGSLEGVQEGSQEGSWEGSREGIQEGSREGPLGSGESQEGSDPPYPLCHRLRGDNLASLRGLPLTSLDLQLCTALTDPDLVYLRGLPLMSLNLRGLCRITGDGLKYLAGGLGMVARFLRTAVLECMAVKGFIGFVYARYIANMLLFAVMLVTK